MKTCTWQEPDDYCMSLVEGRTEYCARHNRLIRKIAEDEKKAIQKHKTLIIKSKEKNSLPRKSVKPVSDKMKDKNTEYSIRVKEWKKENPECKAMCSPDCDGITRDCHHMKKRGDLLMVEKYWLPVCGYCHDWIGRNSKEARWMVLTINHLEPEFIEPHKI